MTVTPKGYDGRLSLDIWSFLFVMYFKSRAKRATAKFHEDIKAVGETNLLLDDHGLILVPTTEEEVKKRCKRSEERFSKYKRLSHSVHVQSDIRYR